MASYFIKQKIQAILNFTNRINDQNNKLSKWVKFLSIAIFSCLFLFSTFSFDVAAQSNSGTSELTLVISPAEILPSSPNSGSGGGNRSRYKICPNPTFRDDNNNSNFDNQEIELELETILFRANQQEKQKITSGFQRCFEGLSAGKYIIEQSPPSQNFKSTTGALRKEIELTNQDISVAFGYYAPTKICPGLTYQDINGNQQQDFFEPLFGNIYTELRDKQNNVLASTNSPNTQCFEINPLECTQQNPCIIIQPSCPGGGQNCENWSPTCPTQFDNIWSNPGQELKIENKFCYQPTILPRTGGQLINFASTSLIIIFALPLLALLLKSFFGAKEENKN